VKTPDWRSSDSYAGIAHLTMREIAWEFLRRNPAYQSDFKKSQRMNSKRADELIGRWGLCFGTDPNLKAREANVCWRHENCPSVIVLSNIVPGTSSPSFRISDAPGLSAERRTEDGAHIIIREQDHCFQLFLVASADAEEGLQANIPLDDIADIRCAAVKSFWRFFTGQQAIHNARRSAARQKYSIALQVLDGCLAGATYREMTEVLFGAARLEEERWKTSTIRASTIRQAKLAQELMDGGYKQLLRSNYD
jgi:hypothetical protein